jgi:hypothetical protein
VFPPGDHSPRCNPAQPCPDTSRLWRRGQLQCFQTLIRTHQGWHQSCPWKEVGATCSRARHLPVRHLSGVTDAVTDHPSVWMGSWSNLANISGAALICHPGELTGWPTPPAGEMSAAERRRAVPRRRRRSASLGGSLAIPSTEAGSCLDMMVPLAQPGVHDAYSSGSG